MYEISILEVKKEEWNNLILELNIPFFGYDYLIYKNIEANILLEDNKPIGVYTINTQDVPFIKKNLDIKLREKYYDLYVIKKKEVCFNCFFNINLRDRLYNYNNLQRNLFDTSENIKKIIKIYDCEELFLDKDDIYFIEEIGIRQSKLLKKYKFINNLEKLINLIKLDKAFIFCVKNKNNLLIKMVVVHIDGYFAKIEEIYKDNVDNNVDKYLLDCIIYKLSELDVSLLDTTEVYDYPYLEIPIYKGNKS